jgi:hypothetical protein
MLKAKHAAARKQPIVREGSRPRDQLFPEPSTDQIESLVISTMQTCTRRAGTRALPELHPASMGLENAFKAHLLND